MRRMESHRVCNVTTTIGTIKAINVALKRRRGDHMMF